MAASQMILKQLRYKKRQHAIISCDSSYDKAVILKMHMRLDKIILLSVKKEEILIRQFLKFKYLISSISLLSGKLSLHLLIGKNGKLTYIHGGPIFRFKWQLPVLKYKTKKPQGDFKIQTQYSLKKMSKPNWAFVNL